MSAEVWLGALQLCLQPSVILFLCIGVCIGTVIGALPGLSATMGIAIMTPITFWFEPADGFAMLMGLWNAAIFAGGISAILVNTPGTPASITQSSTVRVKVVWRWASTSFTPSLEAFSPPFASFCFLPPLPTLPFPLMRPNTVCWPCLACR